MSGTVFCGQCGAQYSKDYNFCPNCGTRSDPNATVIASRTPPISDEIPPVLSDMMIKIDVPASYLVWFNESMEQRIGEPSIWPVTIIWSEQEKQFKYPDGYTITFEGPDKDGGFKGIGRPGNYDHKLYPVDRYGRWKQLLSQNAPTHFVMVGNKGRYHLEVRGTIATLSLPLDMKPVERSTCSYNPDDLLVVHVNNSQVVFDLRQQQDNGSYGAKINGDDYHLWPILMQ